MHAKRFLHILLKDAIHGSRFKIIVQFVLCILLVKELNLTKIGRSLCSLNQERSNIRMVDRWLGNLYFQTQAPDVYKLMIQHIVGTKVRPVLIVDWSKLPNTSHEVLRVAYMAEGRALTLYEEIHPSSKSGNGQVHRKFLMKLKSLLPTECRPIVVTDAGFKNPWFKVILKLGWDFIGRVRGNTLYGNKGRLSPISELFGRGGMQAKYLGTFQLTRKNPMQASFYLYRGKLKGRKKHDKSGKVSNHKDSKDYGRRYRESWVLVSSLRGEKKAKKVVEIYRKRMTIEEAFRDMKSARYGLNMKNNRTLKPARLVVWLLMAALASLVAYSIGALAEKAKMHYQFQANTIRNRRVLSFFYLGCQIIKKKLSVPEPPDSIFEQEVWLA